MNGLYITSGQSIGKDTSNTERIKTKTVMGDRGGGPDESMLMAYLFFVLFPHQLQGDGPKIFKF